jgi:uncharacterized protein (TIGR02246 family)
MKKNQLEYKGQSKTMTSNEQAVATLLANYQDALNQSDTDAVMRLYASDGVFMPQHSPSSVRADAVRKAYDAVFKAITLKVRFEVAEIHEIAPDWVIARTNSAGTVKVKATGGGGPEANQELFVFQNVDGTWKIARYCFSTTKPPGA